jgi:hypothetical protein
MDNVSELRDRVVKMMEKNPHSYDYYAKKIGLSLHTFFYFMKAKKEPARLTIMKIELFLKKSDSNEKDQ